MNVVRCKYCLPDHPCGLSEFNELTEGRFKKENVPDMVNALNLWLEEDGWKVTLYLAKGEANAEKESSAS